MTETIITIIAVATATYNYIRLLRETARANRAEAALRRIEGTVDALTAAVVERVNIVPANVNLVPANDTSVLKAILADWRARDAGEVSK